MLSRFSPMFAENRAEYYIHAVVTGEAVKTAVTEKKFLDPVRIYVFATYQEK